MKSLFISAITTITLIFSSALLAAPPNNAPATSTTIAATAPSKNNEEMIALRTQLVEMQRFQEQVLSTVYWSLGTLAGVAVLLIGFGWWTNFRVYERDKDTIERELRSMLLETLRQSREELQAVTDKKFSEVSEQLNTTLASNETKILDATKSQLESSGKKLEVQLSQAKSSLSSLQNEVRELQLEACLQQRLKCLDKKSYRNALQDSVSALGLANRIGNDYSIGEVLDLVTEDINTILKGNDLPIDNFLVAQLIEVLGAVKGSHAHAAAALKAKAPKLVG